MGHDPINVLFLSFFIGSLTLSGLFWQFTDYQIMSVMFFILAFFWLGFLLILHK